MDDNKKVRVNSSKLFVDMDDMYSENEGSVGPIQVAMECLQKFLSIK